MLESYNTVGYIIIYCMSYVKFFFILRGWQVTIPLGRNWRLSSLWVARLPLIFFWEVRLVPTIGLGGRAATNHSLGREAAAYLTFGEESIRGRVHNGRGADKV